MDGSDSGSQFASVGLNLPESQEAWQRNGSLTFRQVFLCIQCECALQRTFFHEKNLCGLWIKIKRRKGIAKRDSL